MAPMQQHREANGIEKQLQLDARKQALKRWDERRRSRIKGKRNRCFRNRLLVAGSQPLLQRHLLSILS
jgi:hypothetical protein